MGVRLMQRAKPMAELLVILLVITCTFVAGSEGDKKELEITRGDLDAEPHRLSHKVKPLEYEIDLTLQNGFDSLAGTVNILLEFVARKIEPETLKSRSSAPKLTLSLFGGSKQRKSKAAKDEIKMNEIKETAENEDNQWGSIDLSMDGSKLKVTDAKMQVARHIGALRSEAGEKLDYMREEIEIDRVLVDVSKQMISLRLARGVSVVNKFGRITITYETVTPDDEASLEKSETLRGGTPNQKRIFSSPAIRGLFPSFDEVTFESKFRVTIRQPASDETILSSLPKRADTIILVDPVKGTRLKECKFVEHYTSRHPSEIGFAIGQFFQPPKRDESNDLEVLEYPSVPNELVDFVLAYYPRFQAWIRENRPMWTDNGPISYLLANKFIVIGPKNIHYINTGPLNDVESALTMALLVARHSLREQFKTKPGAVWFKEGMIVHLAIEMVRDLEPSLKVDEYVRSSLIPTALEFESSDDNYLSMLLYHPDGGLPRGKDGPKTRLFWRLKCAAFLGLLKRKFYHSQEPFDLRMAKLAVSKNIYHIPPTVNYDIAGALKSLKHSQEEIYSFILTWIYSATFPYVEASLDKQGNSLTLIQIPIKWMDKGRYEFAKDMVFPMSIRVNFSDGMDIKDHKIVEFDAEHASYKLAPLPDWFQHSNPEHRISFGVVHQEELPYYRIHFDATNKHLD